MEKIVYYSRNGKKLPFEVIVELDGQVVYINCNCPLGVEKKICRHKINAIRGDRENKHSSTSEEVIARLRCIFGGDSSLRRHLEEKWRLLREFASENPNDEEEVGRKRKMLGEAFANGFLNENSQQAREPFDVGEWEDARDVYADGLNCAVTLKYVSNEGVPTARDVIVEEVFFSNSKFYILGYCSLRKQKRTFRIDRIQGIDFLSGCSKSEKSLLLDVVFQGNSISHTLP